MIKEKVKAIWCDHCNTMITISGVRSCLRQTCKTKDLLPDAKKVFK